MFSRLLILSCVLVAQVSASCDVGILLGNATADHSNTTDATATEPTTVERTTTVLMTTEPTTTEPTTTEPTTPEPTTTEPTTTSTDAPTTSTAPSEARANVARQLPNESRGQVSGGDVTVPVETEENTTTATQGPIDCRHCNMASIQPILNGPNMTFTTEALEPVNGCLRARVTCLTIKTCKSHNMTVTTGSGTKVINEATTVHTGDAQFACMDDGKYAWNDFTGITSLSCNFDDCSFW